MYHPHLFPFFHPSTHALKKEKTPHFSVSGLMGHFCCSGNRKGYYVVVWIVAKTAACASHSSVSFSFFPPTQPTDLATLCSAGGMCSSGSNQGLNALGGPDGQLRVSRGDCSSSWLSDTYKYPTVDSCGPTAFWAAHSQA